jgi:hypothetical protein
MTCESCNNYLGTYAESTISNNGYLVAAQAKLGLRTEQEAFRRARKIDVSTGEEYHLKSDGKAKIIPRKPEEGQFVGADDDCVRHYVRKFQRENRRVDPGQLKRFFDDPSATELQLDDRTIRKRTVGGEVTIQYTGLVARPDKRLIAKIACEFLALNGLQLNPTIRELMNVRVRVSRTSPDRIVFTDSLLSRIVTNADSHLSRFKDMSEIGFRPYHYIVPRLSQDMYFGVEVMFFGTLNGIMVIGKVVGFDEQILSLIDEALILPLGTSEIHRDRYPNLVSVPNAHWRNAVMRLADWEATKKGL